MNQLEFARIHEMQFHGDIRFHLRLHEMTKEPFWPEPVPPHWHEEYEFLVITRGTGTACLNTRTMHIESGDILFINAGIVHSFRGDEKNPLAFYALDFGRELISSYGNDDIQQKYISRQANGELIFRDHFKKDDSMWPYIEEPLEEIRVLCSQEMAKNELLIKSNLLRIWHYLCLDAEATSFTLKKKDDERVRMIKQILQYIQENYARNLTLCGLAAYFHMSEGQFCRFFKLQQLLQQDIQKVHALYTGRVSKTVIETNILVENGEAESYYFTGQYPENCTDANLRALTAVQ